MNPTLYLSCLVVIVGSLAWTARAAPSQGDQTTFSSEATRLKNIYGSDTADQLTSHRYTPDLVNFYDKYGSQLQLTPEERLKANNALKQYKDEQAKLTLVEGVPPQGTWWLAIPFAVDILKTVVTKAIEILK